MGSNKRELTLTATDQIKTDLTDLTGLPTTNGEFLSAIFQGLPDPLRPFVLGFGGNPLPVVLGKLNDGFDAIVVEQVFPLLGDHVHCGRRNGGGGGFSLLCSSSAQN
jgi:hypothetical protein